VRVLVLMAPGTRGGLGAQGELLIIG
jgi:hypothetical protein